MTESITLRPATIDDARLLLEWRNDPETRRSSHNTETVELPDHVAWLTRVLENPDRELYVAEYNGVPVGTVRADHSHDDTELSWTAAPSARGKGIAKRMVAHLASRIDGPIRAEVKSGNVASRRIAEYAGMRFQREVGGVLHYFRPSRGAIDAQQITAGDV